MLATAAVKPPEPPNLAVIRGLRDHLDSGLYQRLVLAYAYHRVGRVVGLSENAFIFEGAEEGEIHVLLDRDEHYRLMIHSNSKDCYVRGWQYPGGTSGLLAVMRAIGNWDGRTDTEPSGYARPVYVEQPAEEAIAS